MSGERTLDELMAMMTERRFRHLPVITDDALAKQDGGEKIEKYLV